MWIRILLLDADPHPDPLSIRGRIRDQIRPVILQHLVARCRMIPVPSVASQGDGTAMCRSGSVKYLIINGDPDPNDDNLQQFRPSTPPIFLSLYASIVRIHGPSISPF